MMMRHLAVFAIWGFGRELTVKLVGRKGINMVRIGGITKRMSLVRKKAIFTHQTRICLGVSMGRVRRMAGRLWSGTGGVLRGGRPSLLRGTVRSVLGESLRARVGGYFQHAALVS